MQDAAIEIGSSIRVSIQKLGMGTPPLADPYIYIYTCIYFAIVNFALMVILGHRWCHRYFLPRWLVDNFSNKSPNGWKTITGGRLARSRSAIRHLVDSWLKNQLFISGESSKVFVVDACPYCLNVVVLGRTQSKLR